jgi:hypothetical protein
MYALKIIVPFQRKRHRFVFQNFQISHRILFSQTASPRVQFSQPRLASGSGMLVAQCD